MIIAIANQKGGVGKTTLAVHLATWLARAGKRVILVDADPQGNATSWLLDGKLESGLFHLLVVEEHWTKIVRSLDGRWGFGLLPGNERTGEAMLFLAVTGKRFDTVARALRPVADVADYLLIDMPPSKGAGFQELLFAADWVLVPTKLERLSLEGVGFMAATCLALREEHKRGPRLLGVVPNMVRRTVEHREQLETLVETFGAVVWPPVGESIRVAEACGYGQTLFDFAPKQSVTAAMALVGQRFLENTGGNSE